MAKPGAASLGGLTVAARYVPRCEVALDVTSSRKKALYRFYRLPVDRGPTPRKLLLLAATLRLQRAR